MAKQRVKAATVGESALNGLGLAAFLISVAGLFDRINRGEMTGAEAHAVIAQASRLGRDMAAIPQDSPTAQFAAKMLQHAEQLLHAMTAEAAGKPQ